MINPAHHIVLLQDCSKGDARIVGGKAANLGEMIQNSFPVPGGFVITSATYQQFIRENGLEQKIKHLLGTVNFDKPESIDQVSRHIRQLILRATIPQDLVKEIFSAYTKLGRNVFVAIRSSSTSEDSKEASFAGQQETYLNVKGEAHVVDSVRRAWASLFTARSIFYRHDAKMDPAKASIALVVQRMVNSEISGVMFTADPVTNNKKVVVIEAIYGLGEYIVQGEVTPDHYEVEKDGLKVTMQVVAQQNVMLVRAQGENKKVEVSTFMRDKQKLGEKVIAQIAQIGIKLEKHYFFPQDIEWAIEKNKLYIVQTRPITTLRRNAPQGKPSGEKAVVDNRESKTEHPILIGDPASPGIAIGKVVIVASLKDLSKVKQGDIMVAPVTNPDYVPAMKKAAAIITEKGGRTSHAAIVSREFGIPAVVGALAATDVLKPGMVVTVNGRTGEVYAGSLRLNEKKEVDHDYKTLTKLYVNMAEPELAVEIAKRHVDGIGLLRAEFMIAQIGIHPKKIIQDKKQKTYIDSLADNLRTICQAFYPRPVLYRATDFKTNEYRSLKGGAHFEPVEPNPMLGYRGAFRYVHDPKVFNMELTAIKKVREKYKLNNLRLMLPFVRTVQELKQVKKLINDAGLRRSTTFKLFMMVEIPSNVILIEDFIEEGIDGISIGSNDLTMLTLGTDRDNSEVAVEFDERNAAVLWSFERVIKAARKHGIEAGICGQAPSEFPDLVEKLVEWGIHSISVSPDAIVHARDTIHTAEKRLISKLR